MEEVRFDYISPVASEGTSGRKCQAGNCSATVSALSDLGGGLEAGGLAEADVK